jgi:hypothetical protein
MQQINKAQKKLKIRNKRHAYVNEMHASDTFTDKLSLAGTV